MEENKIRKLFDRLCEQNKFQFPKLRTKLDAPTTQGVYVIRCSAGKVMHVGRSVRGREGLAQRLGNHLRGQSSFAKSYLKGNGRLLREGYTYQYLVVADKSCTSTVGTPCGWRALPRASWFGNRQIAYI